MLLNEIIAKASIWIAIIGLSMAVGYGISSNRNSQLLLDQRIRLDKQEKIINGKVDKVVYKYVTKKVEVAKYVPSQDNTCAVFDGNFRLFYDSAATGVPQATGDTDAAPASINEVADSIASNFASCTENANQLMALQEWARLVSK